MSGRPEHHRRGQGGEAPDSGAASDRQTFIRSAVSDRYVMEL